MTVHLVGSGPGDPELLTLRAARLLGEADVVVHDRLVGRAALDLAPRAELVDVGKRAGSPDRTQHEINATLVDAGRRHRCVVRLKGGDPYLFGRGSEEVAALRAAGIDVEVVPGVTSAFSAPLAGGVPVTHRATSTGVTVVTASVAPGTRPIDWGALARLDHTLVVLMGVRLAPSIAADLIAGGRSPAEPVAVVGSATTDHQLTVRTDLAHLPSVEIPAPAVIVVGAVAAIDDLPSWQPSTRLFASPTGARPNEHH